MSNPDTPLRNIALIGASGSLGSHILAALQAKPDVFKVTVVTRASSPGEYPPGTPVIALADTPTHADLVQAFRGKDAVVNAARPPPGAHNEVELKYAGASAEAGARRYITGHFAGDLLHAPGRVFNPMYDDRAGVLDEFARRRAAGELRDLTWTCMATGVWLDWALEKNFFSRSLDLKARKARVYDSGAHKFTATVLPNVGIAVARVLEHPAETADRMVYIQDLSISLRDLIGALERQGGEKWEVEVVESKTEEAEVRKLMAQGNATAAYGLVGIGILGDVEPSPGTWFEESRQLDNELLGGLPKVDLDDVVKRALKL